MDAVTETLEGYGACDDVGGIRLSGLLVRAAIAVIGILTLPALGIWFIAGEMPLTGIFVSGLLLYPAVALISAGAVKTRSLSLSPRPSDRCSRTLVRAGSDGTPVPPQQRRRSQR